MCILHCETVFAWGKRKAFEVTAAQFSMNGFEAVFPEMP